MQPLINKKFSNRILLVDDEPSVGSLLPQMLMLEGGFEDFEVTYVSNSKEALEQCKKNPNYDLCLLDVMLPDCDGTEMDGLQLAQELRKIIHDCGIIFFSASDSPENKINGYEKGRAYAYVLKTNLRELISHIKGYFNLKANPSEEKEVIPKLRNASNNNETHFYRVGTAIFNSMLRTLTFRGKKKPKRLSPKESELFKLLCQNVNNLVSREDALAEIWGIREKEQNIHASRSIDVYINKLRGYFKEEEKDVNEESKITIINIHNSGFCLNDPSQELPVN